MTTTLRDLVLAARQALEKAGIDDAAREARLLAGLASGIATDRVAISMGDRVDHGARSALDDLLRRRAARVPMSHIVGYRQFYRHRFDVTPDVLDPRPETECLIEAALERPFRRVLDLGTGSGAIVISLLAAMEDAQGVGTDVSEAALGVAEGNARRIGLEARCAFVQSDWFTSVEGEFDLIVSNPPYIALDEMAGLAPELAHEPRMALTDEADGLSAYRAICRGAPAHLSADGRLMVEIGASQGTAVSAMFRKAGLADVVVLPDLDGRDRVVTGRMQGKSG